jgi:transcription-repair coupling factor (superfamily II helicase)
MYNHLSNLVPEASIGIAHGQMPENELADVMHAFTNGHIDVLLCTSIIESGLDIPNANTLIVDRADTFGLAQLYQLRGRVGRGAQRAYAYLFRHNRRPPTPEGQERLETLAENTQLGSGYAIAMRDLEMRGAGELLGTRQSVYIASVGFHLYTKLLAQSVRQLRLLNKEITENEVMAISEIPSLPINIDLPLSMEIPPSYIPDLERRLKLYQRISNIRTEEEIVTTAIEFEDRFGPLPDSVENLLIQMKVKIRASRIGITSIGLENGQITMKFPPLPQGIDYRPLPQIDNRVRIGKNAYRINLDLIKEIPWQTFLLETLYKMEKAFTP